MQRTVRLLAAVALAGAIGACGVTSPSDLKSETWSGSVSPGGTSNQFDFSTSKTGEFIVKITAESPDPGAALLIEYGTQGTSNGLSGCAIFGSFVSYQGAPAYDTSLPSGKFCLIATDPGSLPRAQTFTATVSHL